jgi:acetyl-CoA acetyltransferase
LESGLWDEKSLADVVAHSLASAEGNDYAVRSGATDVNELLAKPMFADPLRKHDCAPVTDGAVALVLAAGDKARQIQENPAWITGFAHVTDGLQLGTRDLTTSNSAERAAVAAGGTNGVQVAELHAPFSHQELILRSALELGDDVTINPSGGSLGGNPMFAGGAIRIGEAAKRIWDGSAQKTLGHATSGPALQQNLICVMEGAL